VILQEQLRRAGLDVTLNTLESNAFNERLLGGDYQAAVVGAMASLMVDPSVRWQTGQFLNYVGYTDPESDALIAQGLAAADPAEADECWRKLQDRIHEAQPYAFLYWREDLGAVNARVRDVTLDLRSPLASAERWWVAP